MIKKLLLTLLFCCLCFSWSTNAYKMRYNTNNVFAQSRRINNSTSGKDYSEQTYSNLTEAGFHNIENQYSRSYYLWQWNWHVFSHYNGYFGYYWNYNTTDAIAVSFVFANNVDEGIEFKIRNETRNTWFTYYVPSRAWFLYTFRNGQQLVMDEMFFYHDTVIFRNSETNYTYQILGWRGLENVILLADPSSMVDNLWYISWVDWKARSATVSQDVAWQFMLWTIPITDTILSNVNRDYYYNVSPWGTFLFPTTQNGWFTIAKGWKQVFSNYESWSWFMYSSQLNFETPAFWSDVGNTNNWTWTILPVDNTPLQDYNSCVWYNSVQNAISKSMYQCRKQWKDWIVSLSDFSSVWDYLQWTWIIENWSWSYPHIWNDYCDIMVENTRSFAKIYFIDWDKSSETYYNDIQYIMQNTIINDDWSDIINVELMCWSRPVEQTENNACSRNTWDWIINCLGLGWSSSSGWTWESGDISLFEVATNNLANMVSNSILWKFITPIQQKFQEWYTAVNGISCQAVPYVDFPFANTLVYIIWIIIFLVLYRMI